MGETKFWCINKVFRIPWKAAKKSSGKEICFWTVFLLNRFLLVFIFCWCSFFVVHLFLHNLIFWMWIFLFGNGKLFATNPCERTTIEYKIVRDSSCRGNMIKKCSTFFIPTIKHVIKLTIEAYSNAVSQCPRLVDGTLLWSFIKPIFKRNRRASLITQTAILKTENGRF